jgi:hypothetical protein
VSDTQTIRYSSGLALGQVSDFTALAVLEQTRVPETPDRAVKHYALRHLERFPIGTPYTEICVRLAKVLKLPRWSAVRWPSPPVSEPPAAAGAGRRGGGRSRGGPATAETRVAIQSHEA